MGAIERRIAQEAKAMTREEVLVKAIEKRITWLQAADILGLTPRHVRRIRANVEEFGLSVLKDKRAGTSRRKRVSTVTIETLCRLKRERYPDFSVRHFHEFATEKHGLKLSYTPFECIALQLPKSRDRRHFVRCPVLVHELVDGSLAVSHQAKILARFTRQGDLITLSQSRHLAAARSTPPSGHL